MQILIHYHALPILRLPFFLFRIVGICKDDCVPEGIVRLRGGRDEREREGRGDLVHEKRVWVEEGSIEERRVGVSSAVRFRRGRECGPGGGRR